MIVYAALGIVVGLILQNLLLIAFLYLNFRKYGDKDALIDNCPTVSIIIPFRNEAGNIPRITSSLERLDYPRAKMQIILGDDGSEDQTGELLQLWAVDFPHVQFFSLKKPEAFTGNGKAWALQQLCKHATGDYFLFTDADCDLPAQWVKAMVAASQEADAAMVSGITHVEATNLFATMQSFDWLLNLGIVKVVSDLGSNITSIGNNMLLKREDYERTGGFEQTYQSLTEDFEMSKCIATIGGKHVQLVSVDNLITTQHMPHFHGLLQQRKRWMSGAMELPFYWKLLLGLQVFFFPSILLLIILSFWKGIALWLCKLLIQSLFLALFTSRIGLKMKIWHLCLFEIYYFFTAWCTIVYYFWPGKTVWKGRKYA